MLQTGQPAPDFTLPHAGGGDVTLSALAPAPVVVFFYPKDDTPGCTIEAGDFTRLMPDFAALGVQVLGISKDSVASHCAFRDKYELGVVLLSDAGGDTCERYGVWGEKKMRGKTHMGIIRATFLIGPDGTVARVWPKIGNVEGHAEEVLQAARAL